MIVRGNGRHTDIRWRIRAPVAVKPRVEKCSVGWRRPPGPVGDDEGAVDARNKLLTVALGVVLVGDGAGPPVQYGPVGRGRRNDRAVDLGGIGVRGVGITRLRGRGWSR